MCLTKASVTSLPEVLPLCAKTQRDRTSSLCAQSTSTHELVVCFHRPSGLKLHSSVASNMSRFNVPLASLPEDLCGHIFCIEQWANLKFSHAEDWTKQNQGWVLEFKGDLYKFSEDTFATIKRRLQLEFQYEPNRFTLDEAIAIYGKDATRFEDIDCNYQCDGYRIYIK